VFDTHAARTSQPRSICSDAAFVSSPTRTRWLSRRETDETSSTPISLELRPRLFVVVSTTSVASSHATSQRRAACTRRNEHCIRTRAGRLSLIRTDTKEMQTRVLHREANSKPHFFNVTNAFLACLSSLLCVHSIGSYTPPRSEWYHLSLYAPNEQRLCGKPPPLFHSTGAGT
jgi:hypothetical protein